MIRPRQWQDAVILVPGPARFDSPQLHAAIAAPRAAEWRCLAGMGENDPAAVYAGLARVLAEQAEGGDRGA